MDHNVVRKDNTYSFSVKRKECKVKFDNDIELEVWNRINDEEWMSRTLHFNTIQEFIFFANKLVDILDDYTEEQRGKNENNNIN